MSLKPPAMSCVGLHWSLLCPVSAEPSIRVLLRSPSPCDDIGCQPSLPPVHIAPTAFFLRHYGLSLSHVFQLECRFLEDRD